MGIGGLNCFNVQKKYPGGFFFLVFDLVALIQFKCIIKLAFKEE